MRVSGTAAGAPGMLAAAAAPRPCTALTTDWAVPLRVSAVFSAVSYAIDSAVPYVSLDHSPKRRPSSSTEKSNSGNEGIASITPRDMSCRN